MISVRDGQDITFQDVVFEGENIAAEGDARDGLPGGFGLTVRGSSGVSVENSTFHTLARGATFDESTDIVFRGNEVTNIRSDGADFSQVQNVSIENNQFHNFSAPAGPTDHRDMIQFWTRGTDAPSENISITGNVFNSGDESWTQSIFMRNEAVDSYGAGSEMFYQNVTISQNIIHNAHSHAITVGEAETLDISNNTLIKNVSDGQVSPVYTPAINVNGASNNATIARNIAPAINAEPTSGTGWSVDQNLVTQSTDPHAENYVGTIFVNPNVGGIAELADLQLREGINNVGADLSQFDMGVTGLAARVSVTQDMVHQDSFTFDAGLTSDGGTLVGDNAVYTWRFGDGEMATGRIVSHSFENGGRYEVELTITDDDDRQDMSGAWIEAPDELRMQLQATENGFLDHATTGVLHELATTVDGDGYGVAIGDTVGCNLDRADLSAIYGMSAFEIGFSLRATDGVASAGEVMRIHQNFRIEVTDTGSFVFQFFSDNGDNYTLETAQTAIFDSAEHQLACSYDSQVGQIIACIDGEKIGSMSANGATKLMESWGLSLGAAYGRSGFDGVLDNLYIRSAPQEIAMIPEGTFRVWDFAEDPETNGFQLKDDAEIAGSNDSALVFDGVGDRAILKDDAFVFTGTNQLSYGFDLQVDALGASGRARVLWKHADHGIQITNSKVEVYVVDAAGKGHWINAKSDVFMDGKSHRVSLMIDADNDILALYVDGDQLFTATHLDLEIRENGYDIALGATPWGGHGLIGKLDNFVLADTAYGFDENFAATRDDLFWDTVGVASFSGYDLALV